MQQYPYPISLIYNNRLIFNVPKDLMEIMKWNIKDNIVVVYINGEFHIYHDENKSIVSSPMSKTKTITSECFISLRVRYFLNNPEIVKNIRQTPYNIYYDTNKDSITLRPYEEGCIFCGKGERFAEYCCKPICRNCLKTIIDLYTGI